MNLINYIKGRAAGGAALAETEKSVAELCKRVSAVEAGQAISAISFVALSEAGMISADTAGDHAQAFDEWAVGVNYAAGNMRRYLGTLYRCVQAHTSQADWTPGKTPALWMRVFNSAE